MALDPVGVGLADHVLGLRQDVIGRMAVREPQADVALFELGAQPLGGGLIAPAGGPAHEPAAQGVNRFEQPELAGFFSR